MPRTSINSKKNSKKKGYAYRQLQNELKFINSSSEKESNMIQTLKQSIMNFEQQIKSLQLTNEEERGKYNNLIFKAFDCSEDSVTEAANLEKQLRQVISASHEEFFNTEVDIISSIKSKDDLAREEKLSLEQELLEIILHKLESDINYHRKKCLSSQAQASHLKTSLESEMELIRSLEHSIHKIEENYHYLANKNECAYEIKEQEKDLSLWESHLIFVERVQKLKLQFDEIIGINLNDIRQLQAKHSELKFNEQRVVKKLADLKKHLSYLPEINKVEEVKVYDELSSKLAKELVVKKDQLKTMQQSLSRKMLQSYALEQNSSKLKKDFKMGTQNLRHSIYLGIQKKLLKDTFMSKNQQMNCEFEKWVSLLPFKQFNEKVIETDVLNASKDKITINNAFLKRLNEIQIAKDRVVSTYKNIFLAHGK